MAGGKRAHTASYAARSCSGLGWPPTTTLCSCGGEQGRLQVGHARPGHLQGAPALPCAAAGPTRPARIWSSICSVMSVPPRPNAPSPPTPPPPPHVGVALHPGVVAAPLVAHVRPAGSAGAQQVVGHGLGVLHPLQQAGGGAEGHHLRGRREGEELTQLAGRLRALGNPACCFPRPGRGAAARPVHGTLYVRMDRARRWVRGCSRRNWLTSQKNCCITASCRRSSLPLLTCATRAGRQRGQRSAGSPGRRERRGSGVRKACVQGTGWGHGLLPALGTHQLAVAGPPAVGNRHDLGLVHAAHKLDALRSGGSRARHACGQAQ